VLDASKTSSACVYFHEKKSKENVTGESWGWTFHLEEDAVKGVSIRFAEDTDKAKDEWMVKLFKQSCDGAGKKRKR